MISFHLEILFVDGFAAFILSIFLISFLLGLTFCRHYSSENPVISSVSSISKFSSRVPLGIAKLLDDLDLLNPGSDGDDDSFFSSPPDPILKMFPSRFMSGE